MVECEAKYREQLWLAFNNQQKGYMESLKPLISFDECEAMTTSFSEAKSDEMTASTTSSFTIIDSGNVYGI